MSNELIVEPYDDDVPLHGENAPPRPEQILDLIRLLATIYKRFGNTAVSFSVRWGASALHAFSEERARIAELEDLLTSARCIAGRRGEETAWERFDEKLKSVGIGSVTAKVFKVLPSDTEE